MVVEIPVDNKVIRRDEMIFLKHHFCYLNCNVGKSMYPKCEMLLM